MGYLGVNQKDPLGSTNLPQTITKLLVILLRMTLPLWFFRQSFFKEFKYLLKFISFPYRGLYKG
jgi:hypothetical protein